MRFISDAKIHSLESARRSFSLYGIFCCRTDLTIHVACYNLRRLLPDDKSRAIFHVCFVTCNQRDPCHGNRISSFEELKAHHLHNRVTSIRLYAFVSRDIKFTGSDSCLVCRITCVDSTQENMHCAARELNELFLKKIKLFIQSIIKSSPEILNPHSCGVFLRGYSMLSP